MNEDFEFCITCQDASCLVYDDGTHISGWGLEAHECYGPFASCPPPELEKDWHLHLTPPTPKEFQRMELSANELEMSLW